MRHVDQDEVHVEPGGDVGDRVGSGEAELVAAGIATVLQAIPCRNLWTGSRTDIYFFRVPTTLGRRKVEWLARVFTTV